MSDRVLVVGGGIGGLTTALALQHHGIACEVHERAPQLNEIGAGLGLWPAPLRVFDRLGIGDDVRALSGPWETAGIRRADGEFLVRYTAGQLGARLGEPTIGVHRGELQALLLRSLPAGVVRTGCVCVGVDPDVGGQAIVRFADGSARAGRAVLAADGRRSPVRAQLFGAAALHDCGAVGWRGTCRQPEGSDWHAVAGETWGGDDTRFGILPISGGRVTWYAGARRFLDDGGKDELLARFGRFHAPIPQLVEATDPGDIWRDAIDDHWPMRRWWRGRVALVGDAAHPMTPDLGQGACHAILDAWALAEALATHAEPAAAFRAYQRARQRRAWFVTLVARGASAGASREGRFANAVAEALMGMTPRPVALTALRFVTAG